jgi:hypothetical protein
MKTMLTTLPLMMSYIAVLLITAGINKRKPGITMYQELQLSNLTILNYFHGIGIIMMIIPAFTLPSSPFFLLLFPAKISVAQTIAFLICFNTLNFFPWKKVLKTDEKIYTTAIADYAIFLYATLRVIFLASYEWFFRGMLLIGFSLWVGMTWSIIINISLYILIHFHKTKKEVIGCLPFGILACVFTIWWQSLWPTIIFHLQIAIINEWPVLQKLISRQKQATI